MSQLENDLQDLKNCIEDYECTLSKFQALIANVFSNPMTQDEELNIIIDVYGSVLDSQDPDLLNKLIQFRIVNNTEVDIERELLIIISRFPDDFDNIVQSIFLNPMNYDKERSIVGDMYRATYQSEMYDLLNRFYEYRVKYNYEEDTKPELSLLFTHVLPNGLLKALSQHVSIDYFDVVMGLIEFPNDDGLYRSIVNLNNYFQPSTLTLDVVNKLFVRVNESNKHVDRPNAILHEYLQKIISTHNDVYAPVPKWIINPNNYTQFEKIPDNLMKIYARRKVPFHHNLVNNLPKVKITHYEPGTAAGDAIAAFNEISKFIENIDVDVGADTLQKLEQKFSQQTEAERSKLFNWYFKNVNEMYLMNNVEAHRTLGGSFPIRENFNRDSNSNDPCSRWGGCRSMVCYENDNYNEETEELIIPNVVDQGRLDELEWFTGSCQNCNRKIRKKHHAVRSIPYGGGWLGCYCSFKCVKDDIPDGEEEPIRNFRLTIIGVFEKIYNLFGIYEREYATPPR